jgi:hypothetical protein
MYTTFYVLMIVGYGGLTFMAPDIKSKLIGILLLAVNALVFYKS